jgi:predicted ATPase/DNA-binding SARP family transcriptional activator
VAYKLYLLGAPRLEAPGTTLALERKAAAVLCYLALEGRAPKYRLAGWLWPDSGESTARSNMRQLLRRLRLAGADVVTGEERIELRPEVELDVRRMSYLENPSLELLRRNAELLEGFDYDDVPDFAEWLESTREELHQLRARTADLEAMRLEKAGNYKQALAYATVRLKLDPFSEEAYRQVARLDYLLGDRGAALVTLARCRKVLSELGGSPLPETLELARMIEEGAALGRPAPRPATVVLPTAVLRPPVLAGRASEWARMEEAWEAGKLIYLSGEPGVGKSRLAEDFLASKGIYFRAASRPGDSRVPHAFGIHFVRDFLEHNPDYALPGWVRQAFAPWMPELDLSPEPPGPHQQTRLAEAYLEVMKQLGLRGNALLVDDVHFMDDASIQVGVYMFSHLSPLGGSGNVRGFISCFRRGELSPYFEEQIAALVGSGMAVRIEVEPLGPASVEALVASLALPDVAGLGASLSRYTGGNPLFILETLKHLIETDMLSRGLPTRLAPSGQVALLIQRRLQRLSPMALNMARAAAVAGTHFDLELAESVLERSALELAEALEELEAAQVLRGLAFVHDLVLEGILADTPAAVGQLLHARTARYLEGVKAHPALIARHWQDGEQPQQAVPWLLEAAQMAEAAALAREARESYAQAADILEAQGDEAGLASVHARLDGLEGAQEGLAAMAELQPMAPRAAGLEDLSSQLTPFVGRERELAELRQLLAEPAHRLVTVLGPGGSGKTRLALELADALRGAFDHGVYVVPLASISSADHLVPALAEGLGLRFHPASESKGQLLDYLRERELLLVLDNFEHLAPGAGLVMEMLRAAPRLKILATSRERLNLSGEAVYGLAGMAFPERGSEEDALEYGAVRLFMQQARLVRTELDMQASDLEAIVRICWLVRGMPLALVLAAGWLEVLTPEEIAGEIARNLDVLESQARDVPERQKSVRAAFESSWRRLPPEEQRVFMRLSVFRGGFTRSAAQAVTGAGLQVLRALAGKSLLFSRQSDRYEVHELLRQYAEEGLEALGEAEATRDAHRGYYLDALQRRQADLHGGRQLEALEEIEAELENVRAAWRWALQQRDEAAIDRAVESLYLFFNMRSRYPEGTELLLLARERLAPPLGDEPKPVWGRVLSRLAFLRSIFLPANDRVVADLEKSLMIARKHGERAEIAFSLLILGAYHTVAAHDYPKALAFLGESLDLYRALDDSFYRAAVLHWLGECHGSATSLDRSSGYTRQSLELARRAGNLFGTALNLGNLVPIALCLGDYAAAEGYCHESLAVYNRLNMPLGVAEAKARLGLLHLLKGDLEGSRALAEEGARCASEIGFLPTRAFASAVLGLHAGISGDYESGRRFSEASLAIPAYFLEAILANWGLAVAHCGLRHDRVAWQHLREALERARRLSYRAVPTWLLPVAAVILANEGQKERAAELLALSFTHPLSATGWLGRWPLLTALGAELEAELGGESYRAAWERGRALDLEEVAAALLNEPPEDGQA